jgi:serine/threonine protein kinase
MVKLADLVHIANNAKTDAQKNAVGEEVKKFLRGKKACDSGELFSNMGLRIEKGKNLRKIGQGAYGAVFYGCLEDKCKTKVVMKVTNEPTAKMEYRIAEKLRGMGVPRMYHYKKCGLVDILYFEYIKGETLQEWLKKGQTADAYRSLISQLIKNLKRIHEKYPKFRHHDLHWNNILVLEGNKPIMIDFGMATIEGVRNPNVVSEEFKNEGGIYPGTHYMFDAHYFLNIILGYTELTKVQQFVKDLFPAKYLGIGTTNPYLISGRLKPGFSYGLPTYDQILKHPFLQPKKRGSILRKILSKKTIAVVPKPQPQKVKSTTASAIRRAKAVLEKEAAKTKEPLKRPQIRGRDPSVMNQVREIEKRLQPKPKPKTKTPEAVVRPKVFINKNGDVKIEKRKCRLYKKEELVKLFKLDPKLTKEQMCKFIKNM